MASSTKLPQRKYLVLFRAGQKSLHEKLLRDDPQRNWDCCVSWYTDPVPGGSAEYSHSGGSNKFDGFSHFFETEPRARNYSYYFLLDDDLKFEPGDISRFLRICDERRLYVAQPSLRWGTNSSWYVTLWNPASLVRSTQSVEVMAPCFSAAAVDELYSTFRISRSTFGMDIAWSALLSDRPGALAVVDAVKIDHIKPIDLNKGAFYRMLQANGINAQEEESRIRAQYPGFYGGMPTQPSGHTYRWNWLPGGMSNAAVRCGEWTKVYLHRALKKAKSFTRAHG